MKVFEVVTEHSNDGDPEVIKTVQYVTCKDSSLLLVTKHFSKHCDEYEKDLISVREVLTIVQHIEV